MAVGHSDRFPCLIEEANGAAFAAGGVFNNVQPAHIQYVAGGFPCFTARNGDRRVAFDAGFDTESIIALFAKDQIAAAAFG